MLKNVGLGIRLLTALKTWASAACENKCWLIRNRPGWLFFLFFNISADKMFNFLEAVNCNISPMNSLLFVLDGGSSPSVRTRTLHDI